MNVTIFDRTIFHEDENDDQGETASYRFFASSDRIDEVRSKFEQLLNYAVPYAEAITTLKPRLRNRGVASDGSPLESSD